ncbi:DUF58 domain-containing protein [Mameliella sp. AT18]|uniref:DUF58 domain-containing protein n=1 Tax=Mameliella sp. AT18 TaxID=3028385 RepID=UPI00084120AF|nr:DUF58 domain-containing protein [Mameliella sp. AT18]MDD9733301.1 DUF58 domain-containing protein [Mameliella sp. AT18]ODM46716.1 hypothetical protein A9320_25270 [Ruegeria sp. PBVC088]
MLPDASGAEVSLDRLIALASLAENGTAGGLSQGLSGGLSGPRRGDGGDLFDLRPFQDGDDLRRIDPAASARSGRPQVRSRHEEVERSLLLVVDFRAPMLWGTRGRFRSVAAAEALALDGWRACLSGARVGAAILRDRTFEMLPPRPREAAMLRISGAFARAHAAALETPGKAHDSLAVMLDGVAARVAPGTVVLLATGLDDPGADFGPATAALTRKCPLDVLLVQDAVEIAPPRGRFAARIGSRISRGQFGRSASPALLARHGIPARILRAADPVEAGMA